MDAIEMTFMRAMKVWWSFVWRGIVLWLPVGLVMAAYMFWIMPFPKHPGPLSPDQAKIMMGRMFIVWVVMVVAMIVVQTFAMRWMLKTRWSDFKLVATPNETTHT
jgi:hypothetical protein